jgi:hypothetical protein
LRHQISDLDLGAERNFDRSSDQDNLSRSFYRGTGSAVGAACIMELA